MALGKEGRIASVPRWVPTLVLAAVLAFLAVGCGSGSSSTSTSTGSSTGADGKGAATSTGAATTTTKPGSSSSGPREGGSGGGSHSFAEEEAESSDQSIQEYGTEASGGEEIAVLTAMHSFFRALAASDYAKVCAGLAATNREQLQQYAKFKHEGAAGCASLLEESSIPPPPRKQGRRPPAPSVGYESAEATPSSSSGPRAARSATSC